VSVYRNRICQLYNPKHEWNNNVPLALNRHCESRPTKSIYRDTRVWCESITNGFNASVLLIGREATKSQVTGTPVTVSLLIDQRHRPGLWGIAYKNCADL
jgi:hypothetical protein